MAEGWVAEQGGERNGEGGQHDGEKVAAQLLAVLEHRQGERDDASVENAAEEVACAGEREGLGVRLEELEVFGVGGVGVQAGAEGQVVAQSEEPDGEDGEGGGEEDGVQDAFPAWGQGERGEVGEDVEGELNGHGVAGCGVDGNAGEEEERGVGERVEVEGYPCSPPLGTG